MTGMDGFSSKDMKIPRDGGDEPPVEGTALPFSVERVHPGPPGHKGIPELKRWCTLFHTLGLASVYQGRSLGNLSFRLEEKGNAFIITASGLALKENLSDDAFVMVYGVSEDRTPTIRTGGSRPPSSESLLHFHVYEKRPEVRSVFHGHSREILKAAESLKLPVTPTAEPFGSMALVRSVLDILGDHRFVVLRRHGFLSLGRTLDEAGEQAVEILNRSRKILERKSVRS